jgi:signal transduction histidine kinase
MNWLWVLIAALLVAVLPLVFPDGTWPSRRWWPVPTATATGSLVLIAAFMIDAWPTSNWTTPETPAIVAVLVPIGGPAVLVGVIGAFAALGVRWHRTDPSRLQPFRVVGTTAALLALVLVATYPWQRVWVPTVLLAIYVVLGAYALAVARFRLHDVEPFLGRAAVGAVLSAVIAAVCAAVVLGVGSVLGQPFADPVLPVIALAAVALLFDPARRAARGLVGRLLFRVRSDRTDVLSRVAAHASAAPTATDVLEEVTELLVRSTGADRAEAWLDVGSAAPAAVAGPDNAALPPVVRVPVVHQGRRFGELRLLARARADLVGDAEELVTDIAHAVAVVLRNEELTTQLRGQLDELRASRQRLVEAHERGRHSLERDIHDGAQSRLIALRLRVGAAHARFADLDPDLADELATIAGEVDAAVRSLRDLARGLAPALLGESGVAAALRAHTRGLPLPVTIAVLDDERHHPAVESAAYFCCLEALQNSIRHGAATTVTVELDGDASALRFTVSDDGAGFDPDQTRRGAGLANICDRIEALGGYAQIETAPGAGTRIAGVIPSQPAVRRSFTAVR